MFCENCGNQLHDEDCFCQRCGAPVPGQPGQQEPVPGPGNSKGRGKVIAAVAAIAVVLIAAAVFVILQFLPADKEQRTESSVAEVEPETPEDENADEEDEDEPEDSGLEDDLQSDREEGRKESPSADENKDVQETKGAPTGLTRDGVQVYMADFDITASSVLVMQGYNYEEKNLTDLDTSTCWAEGAAGDGTNETLRYTSTQKQSVSGLAILPGYTKSKDLYDKNCAPSMIRIECGGKTYNYSFSRSDVSFAGGNMLDNLIYIDFGETLRTDECTVTILGVSGASMADCCISEMFLYN